MANQYPDGSIGNVVVDQSITFQATGGSGVATPITIKRSGANVLISNLPTSNPHVVGALWNSSGTLTVSSG